MTLSFHLQVVGIVLMLLGVSHAFFDRHFGWKKELLHVSLLTRKVFFVHTFFIALDIALAGAVSFLYADALLRPTALNRALLGAMAVFWFCRLVVQFFVYDSAIWRGDRFRTFMHIAFALLWCYVAATYGIAFMSEWHL
jgi:hypothetical protein